jgi:hypothetical protein
LSTTSFDSDDSTEWAWTFSIRGETVCLTNVTNRYGLPWQMALAKTIDFSTPNTQIKLEIDAWEKDAPGPACVWEHGDTAVQRQQDNVDFLDLRSLNFGQEVNWAKTLVFPDRSSMSGNQFCSTTIDGKLLKRNTNYMVTNHLFFAPPPWGGGCLSGGLTHCCGAWVCVCALCRTAGL